MLLMKNKKKYWTYSVIFILVFFVPYAIVPYVFIHDEFPIYVELLFKITLISTITYLIALNTSFEIKSKNFKINLNFEKAIFILFSFFVLIVMIIFITAPNIPILQSLRGATREDLSQSREDFLKARQGWQSSLGYIIGAVNAYFIPYFISLAFLRNHKYKFIYAGIFLLYCLSFLEKAYFLKLAIPLFFLYHYKAKNKSVFVLKGVSIIMLAIFLMYSLAGHSGSDIDSEEEMFSILHTPNGIFQAIIWRSAIVPIVTALDGVRIFLTEFNSQFFHGNTSSLIAFITGGERINFERQLYQSQFGGSETGNSNQFFLIEAYINFGISGVVIFSFIVGKFIRNIILSNDIALLSIAPLFIFHLFNAGLIGILFSNGFLLFYIFIKISDLK